MRLVRVAVPVPALDSLTYSLPAEFQTPVVGARVLVPLGNRVLTGCVVDWTDTEEPPASTIKPIIELLDAEPFLPEDVVRLATWVADYYACGIGSALAAAMPPMAAATRARRSRPRVPHGSRGVADGAGTRGRGRAGSVAAAGLRGSARRSRFSRARPKVSRPRTSRHAGLDRPRSRASSRWVS